jgi:transcriptional regulator NrdR family protein
MSIEHEKKKRDEDRGLRCRGCGGKRFRVVYTRAACGGKLVRRRQCLNCGERVTTWERAICQSQEKVNNVHKCPQINHF